MTRRWALTSRAAAFDGFGWLRIFMTASSISNAAKRIAYSEIGCRHLAAEAARMFTARKKIVKEKGAEPDDFEESVAQVGQIVL